MVIHSKNHASSPIAAVYVAPKKWSEYNEKVGHTQSCGIYPFLQCGPVDFNYYGDEMMLFTVRVARRDSDMMEKYRKFVFREQTWTVAVSAAYEGLRPGERIVNISEGGYQL